MLAAFLGLTLLGIWWAAPDVEALRGSWRHFAALSWPMHVALGLAAIGLIAAEMLRTIVFGRALGVRVSLRTSLDVTIADNFFSWLTPGSMLGDPATLYMLGRHGVPWDAATIIVFGEFATGFAFIMGLAGLLLAMGFGPAIVPWASVSFAVAAGGVSLLLLALIVGAFWPEAVISIVDRVMLRLAVTLSRQRLLARPWMHRALNAIAAHLRNAVERLARFRQAGAPGSLALLGSHILYYASFVGILVLLAIAFGVRSWIEVVPVAIIYQAFIYIAPTPGGAGIGEASAALFFGDLLPGGKAFAVVMLFRMLTFYLHVVIGLVYLPFIGVLGEILGLGLGRTASLRARVE